MIGRTKCGCGCGMDISPLIKTILEKIERQIIIETGQKFEIEITSGARCVKHNASVGGAKNSAHILGLACDVACINPAIRYLLKKILYGLGIRRIGDGYDKKKIIHFDIGAVKPDGQNYEQNIEWSY